MIIPWSLKPTACRAAHKAAISPYSIAVAAEAVAAEATTVVRAAASMAMNRVSVRIGILLCVRQLLRHSSPLSCLIGPLASARSNQTRQTGAFWMLLIRNAPKSWAG